ncbi:hypothetical protein JAAARDRAFT_62618 [Jaapia argillacea MUCL 33604]|uniref:Uncharacterized protein n=1 Tax=Jaapia argillacea MUCL 33604 TaxID=933084 RepID=A0A067PJI7_9AGAM|nr:hypothetical protein JAAARDRAFT_62618 [Jaapia argillacea MUCL 33604]
MSKHIPVDTLEEGEVLEETETGEEDTRTEPSPTPGAPTPAAPSSREIPRGKQETNPLPPPPSRELSVEDLEVAKSVVLDLLGWGVPPEYLVESGVSRQAIHKIFTELKLRLPSNLPPLDEEHA